MTAQEIISKLKSKDDSYFFEGLYDNEGSSDEFGEVRGVSAKGGYEGGGEDAERVVHFVDHNIYIMETGFYSSYNGTDWEGDFTEVKPAQKTITVYE